MTIRLALAGTGYIGDIHAHAIQSQAGAQAVAVVTNRDDGAFEFREKYVFQTPTRAWKRCLPPSR